MPRDLGFNDAVLNLVGHAEPVPAANAVGFKQQCDRIIEVLAVESHREALFKSDRNLFAMRPRRRPAMRPCP